MEISLAHGRSRNDSLVANVHRSASARENIFRENFQNSARQPAGQVRSGVAWVLSRGLAGSTCQGVSRPVLFRRGASCHVCNRFVFWPCTPIPTTSSFSARARLALLREAGCEVTIATMTPGDCGSAEHDCRGHRGDPARGGAGLGRADRSRLSLPGVPRPGHLQRRRLAPAGHRGSASDPARHHPDGAAGRLHLRPRDDQPAGPRRLLRSVVPELRHPAVGARPLRCEGSRIFICRSPRRRRPRRPAGAGRLPRRRDRGLRDQATDARVPCQPAQLAAAPAWDGRVSGNPGEMGCPAGRGDRCRRRPRRSASTGDILTRRTICCLTDRAGRSRPPDREFETVVIARLRAWRNR